MEVEQIEVHYNYRKYDTDTKRYGFLSQGVAKFSDIYEAKKFIRNQQGWSQELVKLVGKPVIVIT